MTETRGACVHLAPARSRVSKMQTKSLLQHNLKNRPPIQRIFSDREGDLASQR